MLIPSSYEPFGTLIASLSRRVNANSQPHARVDVAFAKLIKKGEC